MGDAGVNGAGRVDAAAAVGAAPAAPGSAAGAAAATATTRKASGGATATTTPRSAGSNAGTTRSPVTTALTQGTIEGGDEFAFSGGPAAANKVRGGVAPKQAKEVSTGLLVATLAALAIFGAVWGGWQVRSRRRTTAT
jgi:cobalamin biosynthesis Mg chelatase CobN